MSRHRNIRSMRYSDEYDGYDDIYPHSVEEDYSLSPSDAAFMYDRTNQQNQLCTLIRSEEDIAEEDEAFADDKVQKKLTDMETAKLMSCLEDISNILGDAFSEQDVRDAVLSSDYNVTLAVDKLLNSAEKQKEKVPESPKPQRSNIRSRRLGVWPQNTIRIVEFLVQKRQKCANNTTTNFQEESFDMEKLFKPNKNISVNLFEAVILKETVNNNHLEKEDNKVEEVTVSNTKSTNKKSEQKKITEIKLTLKNMPVELLERSIPSKIGFCVCNKIVESEATPIYRKSTVYKSEIVPFKFDSMSPDDISSINVTWKHNN